MKRTLVTLSTLALLNLPVLAATQNHSGHEQHATPQHSGHEAMEKARTKTIMLGEQTVDGVKCKAMVNDVGAAMAQMGMKENYHFMVTFNDAATGAAIEQGTVAVKIIDPKTGKAGGPIALMGMGNHFGADVALTEKGEYQFQVGTKLVDGNKRQFQFSHTIK
jgi:hypothetical protein